VAQDKIKCTDLLISHKLLDSIKERGVPDRPVRLLKMGPIACNYLNYRSKICDAGIKNVYLTCFKYEFN
jgi:hypothetical protein